MRHRYSNMTLYRKYTETPIGTRRYLRSTEWCNFSQLSDPNLAFKATLFLTSNNSKMVLQDRTYNGRLKVSRIEWCHFEW